MAETVGTISYRVTIDTKGFMANIEKVDTRAKKSSETMDKSATQAEKSWGKMGATMGAVAGIAASVTSKAINAVTSSISAAVSRVDTLNNAPKILANLGYSAADSKAAMDKLNKGILGLPTSLDSATTALTSIAAASGKSIDYATDLTLAFNNMALAGGKGPQEAQRALQQFTQAVGRGKFEMDDFNTLAEVMPAQLTQVAKTLLGAGGNVGTLKAALSEGKVSMQQFNDTIIELNAKGGDGFASFSQQAKDATGGVGTSIAVARTSIVRGVGEIIKALGSGDIATTIGNIGKAFEDFLKFIAKVVAFAKANGDWLGPLAVGVGTLAAAILILNAYMKIAAVVTAVWNGVLAANPIGAIIIGVLALVAAWVWFFTKTKTGQAIFQAVINAIGAAWQWLSGIVMAIWNGITAYFSFVIEAWKLLFTGVVTAIGFIWNILVTVFQTVWDIITGAIGVVVAVWQAIFGAVVAVIGAIWGGIVAIFQGVWNAISAAVNWVKGVITGAFQGAKDAVVGVWNTVSGWFKGAVDGIGKAFGAVKDTITAPFKWAFNKVADFWNGTVGKLQWDVPDWVPGIGGKKLGAPKIPKLNNGGAVAANRPYLVGDNPDGSMNRTTELFVPRQAGRIVSANDLQKALGGSTGRSSVINQYNNIYQEIDLEKASVQLAYAGGLKP